MVQTRYYNNVSSTLQLAAAVGSADGTLALSSPATSFPVAPFTIAIDQGLVTEEIVLVGSLTTSTMSSLTRGFDGTGAQPHAAGANVTHVVAAELFNKFIQHLDAADAGGGGGAGSWITPTLAAGFTSTGSESHVGAGAARYQKYATGRWSCRVSSSRRRATPRPPCSPFPPATGRGTRRCLRKPTP